MLAVRWTAPVAMAQPSAVPNAQPAVPSAIASPMNKASVVVRPAPTARSIPISARLDTTDAATVL